MTQIDAPIGVLLVNLGTPDEPTRGAVYRYLKEFLLDERVIDIHPIKRNLLVRGIIAPFRSKPTSEGYKKLWTAEGSPLKVYGERLAAGVQQRLGTGYRVVLAMRYQNPSISLGIRQLLDAQVREIVVIPLFPQYSSACNGSVYQEVMRCLEGELALPHLKFVSSFFNFEPMIDVFVQRAKVYDQHNIDHVLFSYHGLPERQLKKTDRSGTHCLKTKDCCKVLDARNQFCYSAQCYATTQAIVQKMGLKEGEYSVCFQSRLGSDPWVQPYTQDVVKKLAQEGKKNMLVFCPAFVSDCLETTVEVTEEYQEVFEEAGGHKLYLVESLNDHPAWMDGVAQLVRQQVGSNN